MVQTIKIQSSGAKGLNIEEVTPEEAAKIMKEAYARGSLVVDKSTGQIIEKLDADTEELLIMDMISGG